MTNWKPIGEVEKMVGEPIVVRKSRSKFGNRYAVAYPTCGGVLKLDNYKMQGMVEEMSVEDLLPSLVWLPKEKAEQMANMEDCIVRITQSKARAKISGKEHRYASGTNVYGSLVTHDSTIIDGEVIEFARLPRGVEGLTNEERAKMYVETNYYEDYYDGHIRAIAYNSYLAALNEKDYEQQTK